MSERHASVTGSDSANEGSGTKPTKKKRKQSRDETYWEKRQFRVQRLIAWAGVFAIIIYGLQLWEMRKSTDAATKAAKAAEDGIRKAEANSHLDQRAWVGLMSVVGTPQIGAKSEITVNLKNVGKTPASKVSLRVIVAQAQNWMIPDFATEVAANPDMTKGTLAPGAECYATVYTQLTADEDGMTQIESGRHVVYVFGKTTYLDIFGCEHWTTFALTLDGDRATHWSYRAYASYNETDNNCGP
jgi:hypothetical protein